MKVEAEVVVVASLQPGPPRSESPGGGIFSLRCWQRINEASSRRRRRSWSSSVGWTLGPRRCIVSVRVEGERAGGGILKPVAKERAWLRH